MPDTVVLRFRDHSAQYDTIREHQTLIQVFRYVWWGWWRKDSEPDHRNDLEELDGAARRDPIEIGLFDRRRIGISSHEPQLLFGILNVEVVPKEIGRPHITQRQQC